MVVLLFTAVVLTIVVSTTATLALGARGGGVNERAAYQALLAAESGLNTFEARFMADMDTLSSDQKLRGPMTAARLNSWLTERQLGTYAGSAGTTVTLAFEGGASPLTLVTTGKQGDVARKETLQDYSVERSPAFNIRVDAALASHPGVEVRGNAEVSGENGTNSPGTILAAKVNAPGGLTLAESASSQDFSLTLSPQSQSGKLLLRPGDYVQAGLPRATYKVKSMTGNQVVLSTLGGTPVTVLAHNSDVMRVDSAVTAPFTQSLNTGANVSQVKVSDPTAFTVGSTVFAGQMKGTVQAVYAGLAPSDPRYNSIEVKWVEKTGVLAPSSTTIPEGTPIRRDVLGVVSAGTIDTDGKGTITEGSKGKDPGMAARDPYGTSADTAATDMFTYTFGQTKAQMLAPTGWLPSTTTFNGTLTGEPVFYDGNLSLTGSSLCGYGILIVKGNLTVNGTCDAGFYGAIYVMGDYDQQGNSSIQGAVLVEGTSSVKDETKIAGTGQGDGKIEYNRAALLEAGTALSPLTLQTVKGTWRQR